MIAAYQTQFDVHYELAQAIDQFWDDLTRPELFWHGFQRKLEFDHATEGITIWRRSDVTPKAP